MSHHVKDDVARGKLVKDPVCGMDVDPTTTAYHSVHDGHTYSFCSERCRAKFEADPRFADRVRERARSAAWHSNPSP